MTLEMPSLQTIALIGAGAPPKYNDTTKCKEAEASWVVALS